MLEGVMGSLTGWLVGESTEWLVELGAMGSKNGLLIYSTLELRMRKRKRIAHENNKEGR